VPARLGAGSKILLTSEKRTQIFDGELVLPADSVAVLSSP
jgi:hypothetical protein